MYITISILTFITMFIYINFLKVNKIDIQKDKFDNDFSNFLYIISYSFPFKHFIKNDKEDYNERDLKTEEQIYRLNLEDILDLRIYTTLKALLFVVLVVLFFSIIFIIKSYKGSEFNIFSTFKYLAILLMLAYIPSIYFKVKEKEYEKFCHDEISIIQLFIILLIKSNATVEDILFALSKMKTFYKKTFEKAYRISIRDKKEALLYLENKFEKTGLGKSFNILSNMYQYSKNESIRILESNLKSIKEASINQKRKKELSKFSFAQVSIVVPFIIVIVLGAIPFINYGVSIVMESMQGL